MDHKCCRDYGRWWGQHVTMGIIGQTHEGAAKWTLRQVALAGLVTVMICMAPSGCTIRIGQTQSIDPKNAISVPVHIAQFQGATRLTAQLTIKGQGPFAFVIDTGAEVSAIDSGIAAQLELPVAGPPHRVSGVGGTAEAVPVHIEDWHLDAIQLPTGTIDSQDLNDLRAD